MNDGIRSALIGGLRAVLLSAAAVFSVPVALAQEPANHAQDLEELKVQIDSESAELKKISQQHTRLSKKKTELERALLALSTGSLAAQVTFEGVTQLKAALDESFEKTRHELSKIKDAARKRIRILYMSTGDGVLPSVVSGADGDVLLRNAYYLQRISQYDRALLERYADLLLQHQKEQDALNITIGAQDRLRSELEKRRDEQARRLTAQETVLFELNKRQEKQAVLLETLKTRAARLEKVVASLTGGITEPGVPRVPAESPAPEGGANVGLLPLKGKLSWPVSGVVVQKFGKQKHPRFEDLIFSKGVEIASSPESLVKAVAPGKVIFVGRMPGYGTILIVDHGQRYYSLYGRLANVDVAQGDTVTNGSVLARTGDVREGGNFYFEIRKDGSPVDPQSFLSKKS